MKKIVALVLSLVMVLGLATTAFGAITLWAPNGETVDCDVYEGEYNTKLNLQTVPIEVTYDPGQALKYEKDGSVKQVGVIPHYTMQFQSFVLETEEPGHAPFAEVKAMYESFAGALGMPAGNKGFTIVTGGEHLGKAECSVVAKGTSVPYVRVDSIPADADASDYVLVKAHNPKALQGEAEVFAQTAANPYVILKKVDNVEYIVKAEEFTAWSNDCEAYKAPIDADDVDYFTVANAVVENGVPFLTPAVKYAEADVRGVPALVGGEVVLLDLDATVSATKHAWVASAWDEDGVTTNYTCANCKTVGTVINASVNAPAGAKIDKLDDINGTLVAYHFPAVDAPAAGDKVESAQTFDAGIAMYVGMSVMAAAGSAVVLKKKD